MKLCAVKTPRFLLLILVALSVICIVLLIGASPRFMIVGPDTNFAVYAKCTFGTNHVYFYGDASLDPLIKRWTDTNAYRLRYTCQQPKTVIWLQLLQRDGGDASRLKSTDSVQIPEGGWTHLRARLISTAGTETLLATTHCSHYLTPTATSRGHVEGWLLEGALKNHRGSVVQIESPDGRTMASLKIR